MDQTKTISADALLSSELLSIEAFHCLSLQLAKHPRLTASEIIELDLPAGNRVEALLQREFLEEEQLRAFACDFAEHTLHVFEEHAPRDRRPHKCVEAARRYLAGAHLKELQEAIKQAIPAVWQFDKTEFIGALTAGLATTFLDYHDAAIMARLVATHTQKAAHRREWESRKSSLELMTEGEKEATWQLACISKMLF